MDGMSTLARLLSDPQSWRDREALARAIGAELEVEESQALSIAATLSLTEESRADGVDQLWQVRQRMADAQSLAAMGDFDWHIATDTSTWSDELYRIYGYQLGAFDPTCETLFDHVHPDDREAVRAAYQHCYDTGVPYDMVERIIRPDGEVRWLWTSAEVIHDQHRTPVHVRGTSIDVTDQVLAEQAREEAALRLGDARLRRRQASEINDNVVQGLTAAVYALELGDQRLVGRYLRRTLQAASQMMTDLLEQGYADEDADQTLVRSAPASLEALDQVIDATG